METPVYYLHRWHEFVSTAEKDIKWQAEIYTEECYNGAQGCGFTFKLELA
jgi:hypothetical protein